MKKMSDKLRYSNKNKSFSSIFFKNHLLGNDELHTQKLLTILIAQLNLNELRTARTYTKCSKQINVIAVKLKCC